MLKEIRKNDITLYNALKWLENNDYSIISIDNTSVLLFDKEFRYTLLLTKENIKERYKAHCEDLKDLA